MNPIQILVHYWEMRPSAMGAHLESLSHQGVTRIATFVPWQAFESDISHSLSRFLHAALDRRMSVLLFPVPEPGVHYPCSGFPKDLFKKDDLLARTREGDSVAMTLPPNLFRVPSLLSEDYSKRYYGFLNRFHGFLSDFERNDPRFSANVQTVVTGGYWKYFRSTSDIDAFSGICGDFSKNGISEMRRRVEEYYAQPEFCEPDASAANRWKVRAFDEANGKWFHQQSEEVARNRAVQVLSRRGVGAGVLSADLYVPEADPSFHYSNVLRMIDGGGADVSRLSELLDSVSARMSSSGTQAHPPFVFWTGMGPFRSLTDSEKQFLILKSLLLMGGRGGGILLEEQEWFALSQAFRSRTETLARSLVDGHLTLPNRVYYLTSHTWSGVSPLGQELSEQAGSDFQITASLDFVTADRQAQLLVVDPMIVLTREKVKRLLSWARSGGVLVLPMTPLYTDAARAELTAAAGSDRHPMQMNLGIPYRLFRLNEGKVVLFDLPEGLNSGGEISSAWKNFAGSLLSLSDVLRPCRVSDGRLTVVPMLRSIGHGNSVGLFVLNGTARPVTAEIIFGSPVMVSDLAVAMGSIQERVPGSGSDWSSRFNLEVPPCGVLPLQIHGWADDARERRIAAGLQESTWS